MADVQAPRTRYRSIVADSGRWDGFAFRPGDIVISTPPKCGTTWTQMLCALLIFDGPAFPARLGDISPWLDMNIRPLIEVTTDLAAQTHRRIIKTHTPLDGLPLHAEVTYLVVGRDPRDVAIPFEHPAERFRIFVTDDAPGGGGPPTLASMLQHLDTGWQRRGDPNVFLFHYADLKADLASELLRLAGVLGIPCSPGRARELAAEASLARMRERGGDIAPSASRGIWKDASAFFRSGGTREWCERVSTADHAAYEARVAALVRPDLAVWVHGGRLASGVDPQH